MPVQPLVLLEDIKEQLVVLSGNTDFDDRLNRFILVASVSISEHIDRVLDYTAQVDVHRTTNTARFSYDFSSTTNESGISGAARRQRFILKGWPIDTTVPIVVKYDPTRQFADASTIVDPSNYILHSDTGELCLYIPTWEHDAALQVQYSSGYALDTVNNVSIGVDPRIALACIIQVSSMMSKLHPDNVGMDSDRTKGVAMRQSQISKFLSPGGLTVEAASLLSWLKPLAIGRG